MLLWMAEVCLTDLDEQSTYWQTLFAMESIGIFFHKNPTLHLSACCRRPKRLLGHPEDWVAVRGPVLALLKMTHCFARCLVQRDSQLFPQKTLSPPCPPPPPIAHTCTEQTVLQRAVIAQKQEVHSPKSDLDLRGEKQ